MSEMNLNPIGNLYKSFLAILKNVTIKYSSKGEAFETKETKMNADAYLDALKQKDTFYSYIDYTRQDYVTVGITDEKIISKALQGDTNVIPERYHQALLNIRRQRTLDTFVESNNYYRMLYRGYCCVSCNSISVSFQWVVATVSLSAAIRLP